MSGSLWLFSFCQFSALSQTLSAVSLYTLMMSLQADSTMSRSPSSISSGMTEANSRLNSELPFNIRGTKLDVKYFELLLGGSCWS